MSLCIIKLEQIISLKCDWGCDFTIVSFGNINICIYTNFLSSTPRNLQNEEYLQQYWWFQQQIYQVIFSEFGYLGLINILDKNGIYYANYHPGLICEV